MNNCLLTGKNVLITAGPTREPIDPVRYISNHMGGRMGYDLAAFMLQQGARVFLVSGPVKVDITHPMLTVVKVNTASEMYLACCKFFEDANIAIFAAAVSDYRPKVISSKKIINEDDSFTVKMVKNIDIAGAFAKVKRFNQFTVGIATETDGDMQRAMQKMEKKNFDMMIVNSLIAEDINYGFDLNSISVLKSDNTIEQLTIKPKAAVVKDIVTAISKMFNHKQPGAYNHQANQSNSQSLMA